MIPGRDMSATPIAERHPNNRGAIRFKSLFARQEHTMPFHRVNGATRTRARFGILALTAGLVIAGSGMMLSSPDISLTIPAGTQLTGILQERLSTKDNKVGDQIELRTTESFEVGDGRLPAGLVLRGWVTEARRGGSVRTRAKLAFRITRIEAEGRTYQVVTEPFEVRGKSESSNTLKKVIGGAVAGGVVGAVAGDASKGVLIGAVLGSGVAVATDGGNIVLAQGQQIGVRLAEPVTIYLRAPAIPSPR
jgi:hypothetical protein